MSGQPAIPDLDKGALPSELAQHIDLKAARALIISSSMHTVDIVAAAISAAVAVGFVNTSTAADNGQFIWTLTRPAGHAALGSKEAHMLRKALYPLRFQQRPHMGNVWDLVFDRSFSIA